MKDLANLKPFATSTQLRYIDAILEHGSTRAAARALSIAHSTIDGAIASARKRAAVQGFAPDHNMTRVVPDPFVAKRVSTYYDQDGEPRGQWVIANLDAQRREEMFRATVEAAAEELPRLAPLPIPNPSGTRLLNLITVTDYHLGMAAEAAFGGDDWNLEIAEKLLIDLIENVIMRAPTARVAVLNQLGDFLHFDSLLPITPTHGHVLDAASSYSAMVRVAIRVLRRCIDLLLLSHERVHVILAEGNHDLASSVWLRQIFSALYENETRVTVDDSELPYYAYQWGSTMLGFHHGHKKKNEALPGVFSAQFRRMWGATDRCHIHTGHNHHVDEKGYPGCKIIQHPTVSARDSHASRGGYFNERLIKVITYHDRHGEACTTTVTPEMLEAD